MEIDDILYIVIAIVIAVINGIAQKKKKSNQRATSAANPVHTAESSSADADTVDPFEILFGGAIPKSPQEPTMDTVILDDEEPVPAPAGSNAYQSYSFEHAAKSSVEFEQPFEEVKEESLYKQPEVKPIDTFVAQEPISEIDLSSSSLDVEEVQLEDISVGAIKGIDEEEAESRERQRNGLLDDFDAEKAIVYSEIMQPKYF